MKLFTVLATMALVTTADAGTQRKPPSLEGVWQTVEVTLAGGRIVSLPQPRQNLMIITPKYYSRVQVNADKPRPPLPDVANATADELRAVWGPLVAEAGTYEVNGNTITMRPIVAKNPSAMGPGAFGEYSFKLDGDTAWVRYVKNQNGPIADPITVKTVRLE